MIRPMVPMFPAEKSGCWGSSDRASEPLTPEVDGRRRRRVLRAMVVQMPILSQLLEAESSSVPWLELDLRALTFPPWLCVWDRDTREPNPHCLFA